VVHNLGAIALTRGQLDAADTWFRRALTLRVQTVPDSLEVADTLVALGIVTFRRGRAAATEDYAERAVEIQQRLAPGSPSATYGLELLGAAAWERGDLARAERCFLEVLEIRERSKPRSIMSAVCFNNLGAVAQARGDYARAEEHHRRALDIRRELAPGSLEVALSLHNLGTLLWTRRDLDAAETYLRQAIEIREKQAPNSIYAAESYANLGGLARDRGNTARAEELMLKALECWQAAGTDSMDEAMVLGNLGNWKITDGDLDGAEPLIARSLAIRESIAPGGSEHALALQSMGLLAAARGMVDQAEEHFRRSIATFTSSGVARVALSETRHHLGRLLRDAGRREEALEAFSAAVDDLEAVVGRLGGSEETHSTFRAAHHEMYQDLIDLLVELGHDERAFDVLERSRARGFLNMLEQRDLLFSADIPEELDRKRRLARAEVQRLAVELSRTSTEQPEERNRLREALQAAEVKLGETRDAIRELAPRLAALTAPRPLDLEGSRAALDPGTVALSYSVGTERSHLFVLGPGVDEFRAVTLEVGDTMLRRKIRRLRNAVATPFSEPASVARIAADLGDLLLAPVHEEISRSRRVLVVPDGPLHVLPFSVLPEPGGSEPLIAALPLYRASSLTVLAELTSGHPRAPGWGVSAFGDPVYDGENGARTRSSSLAAYLRGEELNPLPWTRNEVANLGTLFPGSAKVWLGADASEEQARVTAKEAGTLHFACHGLVDEVRPLESALALSAPQSAKHDGLLQAWEIFESVRTDARLVVLSACRTGLGRELAGEGIVGLTRAFQFAGARSVVASLWAVADRSTAELMRRFYQRLAAGANVAEALRMAQLELASGPVRTANGAVTDASHPYHWAAFQVSGDWR
jgi:CHAT domain-containing protein/Tfp pilus assembly protein PilF